MRVKAFFHLQATRLVFRIVLVHLSPHKSWDKSLYVGTGSYYFVLKLWLNTEVRNLILLWRTCINAGAFDIDSQYGWREFKCSGISNNLWRRIHFLNIVSCCKLGEIHWVGLVLQQLFVHFNNFIDNCNYSLHLFIIGKVLLIIHSYIRMVQVLVNSCRILIPQLSANNYWRQQVFSSLDDAKCHHH